MKRMGMVIIMVIVMGGTIAEGAQTMPGKKSGMVKIFNAETNQYEDVEKITKTQEQWSKELPQDICLITRHKATEQPFSGGLLHVKGSGIFKCAACGTDLFRTDSKFESGTGWPSFFQPVAKENIVEVNDFAHGMSRVEVTCVRCGAHLGHVFPDGPPPTGQRYCVNSRALQFKPVPADK